MPEPITDRESLDNLTIELCDLVIKCARAENDLDLVRNIQLSFICQI
jgi:hypothetical protein